MNTRTLARRWLFFLVVGVGALVVAGCRHNPTTTPIPLSATNVPTLLPPAPTGAPLTAAPTDMPTLAPTAAAAATSALPTLVLPTDSGASVTIPTVTPIPPSTGAPGGGGAANAVRPRGGVYITRLRMDPATPRNKELVNFFATFINTTGKDSNATWCVEVYRPGEKKSFGITRCDLKTIPPGTSEQVTTGWEIAGIRQCIPVRARAVLRDELDVRTPYVQPNGSALWLDFSACP